jgi:DNA invertase Pin-like site-specific DNA recombinase
LSGGDVVSAFMRRHSAPFYFVSRRCVDPRRVAFYDRASTKSQTTNGSRDAARADARRICEVLNWTLVPNGWRETFLDLCSGDSVVRPGLEAALRIADVDTIAAFYLDRFGRGGVAMDRIRELASAYGKSLIVVNANVVLGGEA